jgi:ATP-dependent Lhr-like helicase
VVAEEVQGGFAAVYPVLRTLEESGRIRRGYFVRGLGGSQFAHPGALERLRALRETYEGDDEDAARPGVVLAATDPANPYGAALPWPPGEGARPMRAAGTHVVLVEGALAAFLGRGEKELRTFVPADEPSRSRVLRALALALAAWAARSAGNSLAWARRWPADRPERSHPSCSGPACALVRGRLRGPAPVRPRRGRERETDRAS